MKKTIDLTFLFYIAVGLAVLTRLPSIGMESNIASWSSNLLLFLEGMKLCTYSFSLVMVLWFLFSKKSVATKKDGSTFKIEHFKNNKVFSRLGFMLLFFLIFSPDYPNQKILILLLAFNAALNLSFKFIVKKALIKAEKISKPNTALEKEIL
jgi:CDP-diglyceride synthetase